VTASAKLGEAAAKDFAEGQLGLAPSSRVCCPDPILGGGATGKFDDVYEAAGKFYILEAKGGQRYASLLYSLSGRRIGGTYWLQGTTEYIRDVAAKMSTSADNKVADVGIRMLEAIDANEWHRFEHYFVSARWASDKSLRTGRGLRKIIAPAVKWTKSVLKVVK
jgi:hypothetical protein